MARKQLPQAILAPVKPWYKFETILMARATVAIGAILAVIGAMDWSPLISLDVSTGFNGRQVMWLGGIAIVKGIADECLRRRNALNIA